MIEYKVIDGEVYSVDPETGTLLGIETGDPVSVLNEDDHVELDFN